MGFLRKVWKGVKKVFKKIGKGIKKVVGKVGKFMDKIGIVGQIALMFILPGIGTWLSTTVQAWATTLGGMGAFAQGVGTVLQGALNFAQTAGNVYKTVTGAITDFIGTAGKYIGGKLGKVGIGSMQEMTLSEAWSTYSSAVMSDVAHILDPWKQAITVTPRDTIGTLASSSGQSAKDFIKTNFDTSGELYKHMEGLAKKDLKNFKPSIYRTTEQGLSPIFDIGPSPSTTPTTISGTTVPGEAVTTPLPATGPITVEQTFFPSKHPSLLGDPTQADTLKVFDIEDIRAKRMETRMPVPEMVGPPVPPVEETWWDATKEWASAYPGTLKDRAIETIEAAPIRYVQQKWDQKDLDSYYAEQQRIAEERQSAATAGGFPFYEDTPRVGLAGPQQQETVGWEYYTGASNQRLGGSLVDPTGTYGYSTWEASLARALRVQ